jgi:hypothetical protein
VRPYMSFERIPRCDVSSAPGEAQVSQGFPGSEGLADVEYASRAATWKSLRSRDMIEVPFHPPIRASGSLEAPRPARQRAGPVSPDATPALEHAFNEDERARLRGEPPRRQAVVSGDPLVGIALTYPNFPTAAAAGLTGKINFLALATPILAFAGLSIVKDVRFSPP